MQPKHKSMTIEIDESLVGIVSKLAQQENQTTSKMIAKLMVEALEHREDIYFSKIADEVDVENSPLIEHEDAWK